MNTGTSRGEEIRLALERVLSSSGFARSERQSRFLRFIVERHLDGRDGELKESVVAVEVFGRDAAYDPKIDAIVRTEAVRLRARLEKYYLGEGRQDPLIIELPKGGYRPVVRERAAVAEPPEATPVAATRRLPRPIWLAAAAALLAVVAGTAWWWMQARPRTAAIAVLPLENLSKDGGTDYFADGLTEEIIRNLSVIDGLTVRSRTSSFALKGRRPSTAEAARLLSADYLLAGSVLLAADQIRVNVELVGASDGSRLWSDRYDRKLTDIFAIQDEISRGIADTLRLRLSGRRLYEANLEAYDSYLRGRQIMARFPAGPGRPVAVPALEFYERAIAKDPNYALAYAGIADAFLAVDRNMGTMSTLNPLPRAREAAVKALELDSMLSEAHAAMAAILAREYAWAEAERAFRRAIDLNPNNALAHLEFGIRVLIVQGRSDEGLKEVRRAVALDPLSPYVNTEAGEALVMAGLYQESVEQFRKAAALDPGRPRPYNLLARALYLQGNDAEALRVRGEAIERGTPRAAEGWMVCREMRAGSREQALVLLQELVDAGRPPRALATAHACLGDQERALSLLEQAIATAESRLPELLMSPELASLRTNPRFVALRQKMNLQP